MFDVIEFSTTGKVGRKKSDVAILSAAIDEASVTHVGSRDAPPAIRAAEFWQDNYRSVLHDVDPASSLVVVDAGEVPVVPGRIDENWRATVELTKLVQKNTQRALIMLGGDQTVTGKTVEGLAAAHGPLTVFHLDAHADCWKHDAGTEMNNQTWVRYVIDSGHANRVVQFGVRGWGLSSQDAKWAHNNDVSTYFANQSNVLKHMQEEVADTSDAVYLSIDMSVLDPAIAPGVSHPEPGGLTVRELYAMIHLIASSGKMVGADVTEVVPAIDPNHLTVNTASRVVMALLTGLACVPADK